MDSRQWKVVKTQKNGVSHLYLTNGVLSIKKPLTAGTKLLLQVHQDEEEKLWEVKNINNDFYLESGKEMMILTEGLALYTSTRRPIHA